MILTGSIDYSHFFFFEFFSLYTFMVGNILFLHSNLISFCKYLSGGPLEIPYC